MKFNVLICGLAGLALVSCEDFNRPMTGSSFDPLAPPGSDANLNQSSGPRFSPGEFVSAAVNNTAFFNEKPKGTEQADKLIDQGTQMKIVEVSSNHLKVELDSGEVGWVPQVMVMTGNDVGGSMIPVDGVYQVYPPIPGGEALQPLPTIDPNGLPPEGAIPAIIDPDSPIDGSPPTLDTVPDIQPVEPEAPSEVGPTESPAVPEEPSAE
ncbi:MAG: hypothetical protein AB8D78_10740 [Akkermansiaceae bacterium]